MAVWRRKIKAQNKNCDRGRGRGLNRINGKGTLVITLTSYCNTEHKQGQPLKQMA